MTTQEPLGELPANPTGRYLLSAAAVARVHDRREPASSVSVHDTDHLQEQCNTDQIGASDRIRFADLAWAITRGYSRCEHCLPNVAEQVRPLSVQNPVDDQGNPSGGSVSGTGFSISWQEGVTERNGAFLEEVLEACRQRLVFFQNTRFVCIENAQAIHGIDAALALLASRQKRRKAEGTQGSYSV